MGWRTLGNYETAEGNHVRRIYGMYSEWAEDGTRIDFVNALDEYAEPYGFWQVWED